MTFETRSWVQDEQPRPRTEIEKFRLYELDKKRRAQKFAQEAVRFLEIDKRLRGEGPVRVMKDRPSEELVTALVRMEAARVNLPTAALYAHDRRRLPSLARFRVWARLREYGYSLPKIAEPFSRDHTSILSALRNLPKLERWALGPIAQRKIARPIPLARLMGSR